MLGIAVEMIDDSTAAMNMAIIDAANTRPRRLGGFSSVCSLV